MLINERISYKLRKTTSSLDIAKILENIKKILLKIVILFGVGVSVTL